MNELYIHMAVWDEPELEFPMERGCGMNEQENRGEERRGEERNKKERKGKEKGIIKTNVYTGSPVNELKMIKKQSKTKLSINFLLNDKSQNAMSSQNSGFNNKMSAERLAASHTLSSK